MPISYKKLFELMEKKGIKKINLRQAGIHPTTVNKLVKDKDVSTSTITKICKLLTCQPADIMEYIPDDEKDYHV